MIAASFTDWRDPRRKPGSNASDSGSRTSAASPMRLMWTRRLLPAPAVRAIEHNLAVEAAGAAAQVEHFRPVRRAEKDDSSRGSKSRRVSQQLVQRLLLRRGAECAAPRSPQRIEFVDEMMRGGLARLFNRSRTRAARRADEHLDNSTRDREERHRLARTTGQQALPVPGGRPEDAFGMQAPGRPYLPRRGRRRSPSVGLRLVCAGHIVERDPGVALDQNAGLGFPDVDQPAQALTFGKAAEHEVPDAD